MVEAARLNDTEDDLMASNCYSDGSSSSDSDKDDQRNIKL